MLIFLILVELNNLSKNMKMHLNPDFSFDTYEINQSLIQFLQ